ncbi:MAG: copper resistance CopC/CopD family protein [Actinomycetota bacterium]
MASPVVVSEVSEPKRPSRTAGPGLHWLAAGLFAIGFLILTPGTARGHAVVVSSEPEAGSELGTAPGVVVLRFTESLNVRLSRAVVTDPTGREFTGSPSGERMIRVPLSTNAPGIYEVGWTTVSTLDGHTLRGSFRFGVGVSPGEGAEGAIEAAPQRSDLLIGIARAVEDAALLLAMGLLLLRRLARREPPFPWIRPGLRLSLGLALLGGIVVVASEALAAAPSPSAGAIANYLTTGLPGVARTARLMAEAVALLLSFGGLGVGVAVTTAVVSLAAAGHAAASPPAWWAITVQSVHLLATGRWAGGILALATLRPPGGWRGEEARRLLDRFSPVAITAFLFAVGTGVLRGIQEVGGVGDLFGSSYGQVLLVKVGAVLAMIPLSLRAWKRLARSPGLEASLAIIVIGAAALLSAFPLPPSRSAAEAEREEASQAAAESLLPEQGDLTLGGSAGQVLVGLTLRPGRPGDNEALVYLLPLEGEEAAGGLRAELSIGGRSIPMAECGETCRRAEVDLVGRERLEVRVEGPKGGSAVFSLPALPAAEGSAVLQRAQERMHRLSTYRLDETLSSGLAVVHARYAFQAPDRMRAETEQSEAVWIGGTRYLRQAPGQQWEVETGGPAQKVPSFIWDFFSPFVAPRLVGTEDIDGVPTQIVAFFGGREDLPVWFRLWVDPDGLVLQSEMRAIGHFMDHRYFDFDRPLEIEPPVP